MALCVGNSDIPQYGQYNGPFEYLFIIKVSSHFSDFTKTVFAILASYQPAPVTNAAKTNKEML